MNRSECCGAKVYDDTDICSECKEHCDVWDDFTAQCTDCYTTKDKDELYGSLHKVHCFDDEWMNDLFTEDDWLCNPCLTQRFEQFRKREGVVNGS